MDIDFEVDFEILVGDMDSEVILDNNGEDKIWFVCDKFLNDVIENVGEIV